MSQGIGSECKKQSRSRVQYKGMDTSRESRRAARGGTTQGKGLRSDNKKDRPT